MLVVYTKGISKSCAYFVSRLGNPPPPWCTPAWPGRPKSSTSKRHGQRSCERWQRTSCQRQSKRERGAGSAVVRCVWCVGKGGVVVRSNLIFLQVWEESVICGAGSRNRKNLETIWPKEFLSDQTPVVVFVELLVCFFVWEVFSWDGLFWWSWVCLVFGGDEHLVSMRWFRKLCGL